ncbi:MAG: hypothetical protein J6T37_09650 [Bacteroidales bacterium]|nr:hypothetical protein [Bacteroidales bacterium]MBO7530124.1 hypothetical protein [Bacteroidales bacterium]
MAELALQNFQRSIHIITTMDYNELEKFRKTEILLNYLNKELVDYSVKLFLTTVYRKNMLIPVMQN